MKGSSTLLLVVLTLSFICGEYGHISSTFGEWGAWEAKIPTLAPSPWIVPDSSTDHPQKYMDPTETKSPLNPTPTTDHPSSCHHAAQSNLTLTC